MCIHATRTEFPSGRLSLAAMVYFLSPRSTYVALVIALSIIPMMMLVSHILLLYGGLFELPCNLPILHNLSACRVVRAVRRTLQQTPSDSVSPIFQAPLQGFKEREALFEQTNRQPDIRDIQSAMYDSLEALMSSDISDPTFVHDITASLQLLCSLSDILRLFRLGSNVSMNGKSRLLP